MSISYEEALETLQSMFGEAWTREGLDTVLRHKNGHMEDTVDAILRHGDRDPQVLIDQIAAGIDPEQSARDMDEALARQLAQGERVRSAAVAAAPNAGASPASSVASVAGSSASSLSSSAPVGMPKGHGTPTTLPDDFLRIPGGFTPPNLVDDEMLARMLQDELFSQELARNPQFAHLARGRSGGTGAGVAAGGGPAGSRRTFTARGGPASANASPVPNIMEKISELGDNTRRRLQLMAAQFNAARANHAQGTGGGGTADSPTGTAATPAAAERRGLLDDMDDLELAARKDL